MAGLGLGMALASAGALAQDDSLPPFGELSERYAPTADISGTPVVGLVSSGGAAPSRHAITAHVPSAWAGTVICAKMVSSDGRYDAERSFRVPEEWRSGLATLDFPTRFGAEINALGKGELGVMVTAGSCMEPASPMEMVPAAWSSVDLAETGTLLVNSFRADETYLLIGALGLDIGCMPLQSEKRTAFDTQCELPAEVFMQGDRIEVELNRIRRGALMGGEVFAIDLR